MYPTSPWVLVLMLEPPYPCLSSTSFLSTSPAQDLSVLFPVCAALFLTPLCLPNSYSILKTLAQFFTSSRIPVTSLIWSDLHDVCCCGTSYLSFLAIITLIILHSQYSPLKIESTPILFNTVHQYLSQFTVLLLKKKFAWDTF